MAELEDRSLLKGIDDEIREEMETAISDISVHSPLQPNKDRGLSETACPS